MYARYRLLFLGAMLGGYVISLPALGHGEAQVTGITSFTEKLASVFVQQWKQESLTLNHAYQYCPLHWHVNNIAYVSMGIMMIFTAYKSFRWGLKKIGMLKD